MANKNKVNSSLLEFLKVSLKYPGRKNISNNLLLEALLLVNKKLSDCCKYLNSKDTSQFLSTFTFLLNGMSIKNDKQKILEVKEYLELQLTPECC